MPSRFATAGGALLATLCLAEPALAQTDYYNLDAGRPVRIEDAHATERYAFEAKLAPLRLERESGGVYRWAVEPELAYGILPRTHVEVGLPFVVLDAPSSRRSGLAGVELSALYTLNAETRGLPALGLRGDLLLPAGGMAPDELLASLTGLLTRTFRPARVHVNGGYTFGSTPHESVVAPDESAGVEEGGDEASRWLAGIALDRAFPLSSFLLVADVHATGPLRESEDVRWSVGFGVRYQHGPRLALDAGVGRRLTGEPGWFLTVGSAYQFALRSLIPVASRADGGDGRMQEGR